MRIAVTGANGFIGRYVLAELAKSDHEIVALVRDPNAIEAREKTDVIVCDVLGDTPYSWSDIGSPDTLIHLAWGGLPNYRSVHHFEQELPAQYRFLSSLIRTGLKNLTVAGTCFEYGMQSGSLAESCAKVPDNCYGFAKDVLRQQLQMLQTESSFNLTWARLFYPYGEGQGPKSLLSQLSKAVTEGSTSFDMSGGEQLRDYLHVEEVARYISTLALQQKDHGEVNICSGEPISVRKLVEQKISENGWNITLNLGHYPYPDYEPMAFWGDAEKLKRLTVEQ